MLRSHRQIARDQRVEESAREGGAGVGAKALVEQVLDPHGAEEEQRSEDGERVVVELGGREREDREADEDPQEEEEERAVARGLRAQADARENGGGARKGEDPGEAVEPHLLDEVDEAAARRSGVHAEGEALEVIVDDEALEEGLALVVAAVEDEHGAVPRRADGEDDERAGAEVEAAQAVPLAGGDAVHERDGAR